MSSRVRAITAPRWGVPATVMPRPRRNSSRPSFLGMCSARVNQALQRLYPIRRGTQVTTTTVAFSFIGQPRHITVPPNAISYRDAVRPTGNQH
jgi:hypothetical protein